MVETHVNPQTHDFDQRLDGPLQEPTPGHHADHTTSHPRPARPSVQIDESTTLPRHDRPELEHSASNPEAHAAASSPVGEAPPRRSTQVARTRRTSRDFDVRRDGPYGRTSISGARRQSSGLGSPTSPTLVQSPEQVVTGEEGRRASAIGGRQEGDPQTPTRHPSHPRGDEDATPSPPETLELSSTDPAFEPEPPPLNYTLHTRYLSITIFWTLILIDSIAMPIALYFGLWYGTSLSPNAVFSIVTAALGGVSIIEYVLRFWRLWKKGSTCRVIGARRAYLDYFHWNFSAAWFVVMVELIIGTSFPHPPIRLLSMPPTSMLYAFGLELAIVDILRYFQYPAPLRISSIPKGAQLRPCVYSIIEDVVAVDGSGGTPYREALNRRYEASHTFRAMLRRLGVFWWVGALACAVLCTILIFTIEHDAAYVVGWSVPFIWGGIWTVGTIWYVRRCLAREKRVWAEELAAKASA